MYQFVDDALYRKRPNGVKLKCIPREEGLELLAEIHGGICGSHIGSRALAGKAFRQGFFWPTASRMRRHSSPGVRRVSSIQRSFISQLKPFKPFLSPGPSRSGGSTYLALSPALSGDLSTRTLQSTSSQSGRRWRQ